MCNTAKDTETARELSDSTRQLDENGLALMRGLWNRTEIELDLTEFGWNSFLSNRAANCNEQPGQAAIVSGLADEVPFKLCVGSDAIVHLIQIAPEEIDPAKLSSEDLGLVVMACLTGLLDRIESLLRCVVQILDCRFAVDVMDRDDGLEGSIRFDDKEAPFWLKISSDDLWKKIHSICSGLDVFDVEVDCLLTYGNLVLPPDVVSTLGPGDVVVMENSLHPICTGELWDKTGMRLKFEIKDNKLIATDTNPSMAAIDDDGEPLPCLVVFGKTVKRESEFFSINVGDEIGIAEPGEQVSLLLGNTEISKGVLVADGTNTGIKITLGEGDV